MEYDQDNSQPYFKVMHTHEAHPIILGVCHLHYIIQDIPALFVAHEKEIS